MLFLEKIVFTKTHHSHAFHDEKEEEEHDDRTPLIYVSSRRRSNSAPICRPDETQSMISFDETPGTKADEKDEDDNGIITGLILALALGIHNLFEGIAIGLQKDVSSFIGIATAVILHHFFAAFSLGINIKGLKKSKSLPMLGSFVLSEPCGIAIGIGLSSLEVPLLNGVFLSLCVGTFIYISSSDILAEEFSIPKQKYTKFVAYLCGVGVFLILLIGVERSVE
ncbi:unnamed protein product [Blepharisma stoltei]|uniref:Uncharacterized protein n=1 Tax=Blepharisma stoltei TaxID=1481888 RepID=A0AAU9JTG7_9CILI|nr:unnamed protein product [Blepharisma stoltei]